MPNTRRALPSVDRLLQHPVLTELRTRHPDDRVANQARAVLQQMRSALMQAGAAAPDIGSLAETVVAGIEAATAPSLRPVINATGVILHTNLGRAPLSCATLAAMEAVGRGYSNLEYDLVTGARGSRFAHLERLLRETTGAEAALAVNNNAGAALLTLSVLAANREVIVGRGQAVEIGGGFRIPDVLRQSGATLVEVGTTNRTRASDYHRAISDATAAVLRVHASNFTIAGFTEQPTLAALRKVATAANVLLLDDLGSGCLLDTVNYGLAPEPRVQDSLAAGVDLLFFSGDKLLGGPQAGIILGRSHLVARLRDHPLARSLRPDKATIAGLAATLRHYLLDEVEAEVPIWRMIATPAPAIRARAERWKAALEPVAEIAESRSMIGGGSLPGESLPTFVLALRSEGLTASRLAQRLRTGEPAVIARVEHNAVLLDPRTVEPDEDAAVLRAVQTALRPDGR